MAKRTISTIQTKDPIKKTKIIRIIRYNNSKKFSFEEKFIDSNLVNNFLLKK